MISKSILGEPAWLTEARKDFGIKEIQGPQTNLSIKKWLADLRAWWSDDETPWCGVAVAHWMQASGQTFPTTYYRATAWETWGVKVDVPVLGAVACFSRQGGGHVGLITAIDPLGRYKIYGGNQGDCVCETWIDGNRCTAIRMPADYPTDLYIRVKPDTVVAKQESSTNEA
jgi:uncharacterized protein (TIGR02594 family)